MKCTVDSLLTHSSIRRTPLCNRHLELVPFFLYWPFISPSSCKTDISLRRTLSACWSQRFWRELSINAEFKVMISCSSCQLVQCMCVHVYASCKHMVILLTRAKLFQTLFLYSLSLFFQDFDKLAWHA